MNRLTRPVALLGIHLLAASTAPAGDYSDPADIIAEAAKRGGAARAGQEIDGTIKSFTSAKPGWYGLLLQVENGKELNVVVAPNTKFYFDYKPLDAAAAYPRIRQGEKIRLMHDTDTDISFRHIMVTDLMFESPPVESAGTIQVSIPGKTGAFDLTLLSDKGEKSRAATGPQTKYYENYKPIAAAAAYPRLLAGQKVRILTKPGANNEPAIVDLMFVGK